MTTEAWIGAAIGLVVALGGGTGIAELLRRARGPAKKSTSLAPAPLPSMPPATREELDELRAKLEEVRDELREAIHEVESDLRAKFDDRVRELVEKLHQLAIRVESAIAAHQHHVDRPTESRRGTRR